MSKTYLVCLAKTIEDDLSRNYPNSTQESFGSLLIKNTFNKAM